MFGASQRYVTGVLLVGAVLIGMLGLVSWFHDLKEREALRSIEERITFLRGELLSLSNLTNRNAADEDIAFVIKDCRERNAYEDNLNQLSTLGQAGLARLEGQFDACGDFFALRKRAMVMKMRLMFNELSVYESLYRQYSGDTLYRGTVASWEEIVLIEEKRKDLLSEQVSLQGSIIRILKAGTQDELTDDLVRAGEVGQILEVQHMEIQTVRTREEEEWKRLEERS